MDAKKGVKLSVLSISCILNCGMMASAILFDISKAYPDAGEGLVQMVLTSISLVAVIFALAAAPLSKRFSIKALLLVALIIPTLGGLVGFFLGESGIVFLFIASAMIGYGQGMCSTLTSVLISDYYFGENRSRMLGMQSAMVSGGGMAIVFVSGLLAGIRWNFAYLVILGYIALIVITLKRLPHKNAQKAQEAAGEERGGFGFWTIYWYFLLFAYAALMYVYMTNVSAFMAERGLGNATTSGMSNTIMLGVGCATGFALGFIKKVFKKATAFAAFFALGLGLLLARVSETLPAVMFAGAAAGFGMSIIFPMTFYMTSRLVRSSQVPAAMAAAASCSSIGMFLSPLIIDPLSNLLAPGDVAARFLTGAALCVLLAVVGLFANRSRRKGDAPGLLFLPDEGSS